MPDVTITSLPAAASAASGAVVAADNAGGTATEKVTLGQIATLAPVQSVNGATGAVSLSASSVTAASATHASQHQVTGADPLVPVTATFTMSVATNDWAPGALDVAYITNTSTANINLSGMSTNANNIYRLLVNVSTHTAASITLLHQATNSTAANQFAVPWQGSYVMSPNGGAAGCLRAADNSRWRII